MKRDYPKNRIYRSDYHKIITSLKSDGKGVFFERYGRKDGIVSRKAYHCP